MKNSTIKNITTILGQTKLKQLVEKANIINDLNTKIQKRLPLAYKNLYRISNILNTEIIFEVQNASVKTGLQLQKNTILTLIKIDFPDITEVSFRINPDFKSF